MESRMKNEKNFSSKENKVKKIIALAGNPNVGKSTVFNALTKMHQHTGNWPGKTVENTAGYFCSEKNTYRIVDLPGTYSLLSHSPEEEIARNFICFSRPDAVVAVCDATCLERNLNLVLQILEITKNVIVCINLMDEARRKGIKINTLLLSKRLGVPVVNTVAHKKKSLNALTSEIDRFCDAGVNETAKVNYGTDIEAAIDTLLPLAEKICGGKLIGRWVILRLLEGDESLLQELKKHLGVFIAPESELYTAVSKEKELLSEKGITEEKIKDIIVSSVYLKAESISEETVIKNARSDESDRRLDRIFTGRVTGFPVMLLFMCLIFWLTVTGANYPSRILSDVFLSFEKHLYTFFNFLNAPVILTDALVAGVYRVLSSVVSVMLPPMMIFFPLFTLLEDSGYLPRIAYNLDKPFKHCNACGKQALTMCMGFGCNAVGVTGCRIIDSPRERLLAILTNCFVPCNGRFPTLIALITMFFAGGNKTAGSFYSAALLTLVISIGVLMTFFMTKLLSLTFLKGEPSSFTIEMPPYRKPQIVKVFVRSVFDRTLKVLLRAVCVSTPVGLVIWLMANITLKGNTLLMHTANFLDPLSRFIGLDGKILLAFILGLPANEIVIPIIIMAYTAGGSITEVMSFDKMKELFILNGWNIKTAVSVIIFTLMHWPCSTTLLTIKKETGSLKWTALAAAVPTAAGIALLILLNIFL